MVAANKPNYSRLDGTLNRIHRPTPSEAGARRLAFFDKGLPAADKLREFGFHDSMTGLLNRAGFDRALELWKTTRSNDDERLAIAYIDINYFKTVNDEFGHDAGDRALMAITEILCDSLRSKDIVARYGGDEIVLGLPIRNSSEEISHEAVFAALDEKLNGSLKQAQLSMAQRGEPVEYLHNLSFAIGVEIYSVDELDSALSELLNRPDERMYEHKRQFKLVK